MKKQLHKIMSAIMVLVGIKANAQFQISDVKYWVGTGTDSSVLVVDFQDATWDTSYAWGYLHDGTATGADMLNAVAAADVNFAVNISGGFLNDITYGAHAGIGGTGGFYWSTWSGTSMANLSMNAGISTTLANGDWFACSFTDFSPVVKPGEPIPAFDPFRFTAQDITHWVGTGTDTTLLVVDFHSGSGSSSFAWGYLHSDSTTAGQMLQDIALAFPNFTVAISGGFLNDITYNSFSGIGGNPDYWSTWSATNLGNWDMNAGIGTLLGNGDLFGCSYTDFAPPLRPSYPTAAYSTAGIADNGKQNGISVYPNPATEFVTINLESSSPQTSVVKIIDVTGKTVIKKTAYTSSLQIPVQELENGFYMITVSDGKTMYSKSFIKQ
jgi:hypothetical protein